MIRNTPDPTFSEAGREALLATVRAERRATTRGPGHRVHLRELLVLATVVVAVIAVLIGVHVAPTRTAPPAKTAAPTAAPTTPATPAQLRCSDLVEQQEVIAAFTRTGATSTGSITPITPYDGQLTGSVAVTGAGGLACAWNIRTSAFDGTAGTLLVQVLPGAASQWSALMYGDGPTQDRRQFAGITAAATCGDPGCGASAVVGTTWVRVDMTIPGIGGTTSQFGTESQQAILTGAAPMISRALATVQHAPAARLDFPKHPGTPSTTPSCDAILTTANIAPLLGSTSASYQVSAPTGQTASITGAAAHQLGTYSCFANGSSSSGDSTANITVSPGQAWAVNSLEGSRYYDTAALRPTQLNGATADESAETTCTTSGTTPCTTVFTLGNTAIQIDDTRNASKIAEAIIAHAR